MSGSKRKGGSYLTEQSVKKRFSIMKRFRAWFRDRFFGCGKLLCHVSAVLCGAVIGMELGSTFFPSVLGYSLMISGMYGVIELVFFLLRKLLTCWLGHDLGWLMAIGSASAAVCVAIRHGAGEGWTWRVFLASAVIVSAVWLLSASLWSLTRRGLRWETGSCAGISALVCVSLVLFFTSDGFADDTMEQYLALTGEEQNSCESLEPSLTVGPHEVAVLDYGPGEELEPDSINLASYMMRDDDMTGLYVDAYLDYEINEVPMRGRVWYPTDGVNCPVLFIAHGNHEITTPSYLGYDYLGEYLASHGYVVVSVDQNACNMLSGENDARAILLLEHIGLLLSYNKYKENPLYGVLDADNIAIAGHSRGGEMVATAYLFNNYDHYPENAVIRFDYGYAIKSIIAISPTVNQYMPADHSVSVEDVNYLLLHGASDRDVTRFMGMSQYENVSFTGNGDYIKSALYIGGANHGQFNTLWGQYDCSGMEAPVINTESLISEEKQQTIACLFIKVFLDVTLRGDQSCRSLLTDWEDYSAQLPQTVYVQCHEDSAFRVIADFEEDSEPLTATMDGAQLYAGGVNWWTEELMDFSGRTSYDTHALRLRWNETANLTLRVPKLDMTDASLTFDICDLDFNAVEEGDYDLLDATITLMDSGGNIVTAQLSDHALVYPILSVKTDKLDFIFDTSSGKAAFSTVSIPVEEFEPEKGEIDFSRITVIKIMFHEDGEVALDNIGITPE